MHIPVLQKEVLQELDPKPNENFIDATLGLGGHIVEIVKGNGPKGEVLGIEADPEILKKAKFQVLSSKFRDRMILVNDSYINLKEIVKKYNFGPVRGILFDLGISSWHLEESKRGFSFLKDEPLNMRYNIGISNFQFPISDELTAEKIVNEYSEEGIEKILKEYGEERFAERIAKKIIEVRKIKPIKTTFQLVGIIQKAVPFWYQRRKIHFATRTFQALRIAVNDELNNLKKVLPQAIEILARGGRLVIISFHSLEDRIVKNFLRENTKENLIKILTKKPIRPTETEIKLNPRSRSAKLRAAVKSFV